MRHHAATFDADDLQAVLEEALASGFVVGKKVFRSLNGAAMESMSYDLPMPVQPRPAWLSIDETPEPIKELPSEAYDRRNGFGRHWGRAEPEERAAAVLAEGWKDGNKAAFFVAATALFFKMLAEDGRKTA